MRPRVWFGERWITSVFDLFEENIRYFPPLLPICDDEDPAEVLAAGGVPRLGELRLHNGTVYRWNRPVYDVSDGGPHLRVENRVLPAGPTVVDMLANAAFYYGLLRALAEEERPIWTRLPFTQRPRRTSTPRAGDGIGARLWWPAASARFPRRIWCSRAAAGGARRTRAGRSVDNGDDRPLPWRAASDRVRQRGRNGARSAARRSPPRATWGRIGRPPCARCCAAYTSHMHTNEPVGGDQTKVMLFVDDGDRPATPWPVDGGDQHAGDAAGDPRTQATPRSASARKVVLVGRCRRRAEVGRRRPRRSKRSYCRTSQGVWMPTDGHCRARAAGGAGTGSG